MPPTESIISEEVDMFDVAENIISTPKSVKGK